MAKQVYTTGQILTAAQMTTLQANDYNQTVSAKVASYTLVAADAGTRITMSNASATAITVNTSIFTAGDTLEITNIGAGICTVTAGTATVSTSSTLALKQFDTGQLYFTSTGVAIFFMADAADAGTSPLTTKGDLYTFTTVDARLAVGANDTSLVADSTQSSGLKYEGAWTDYTPATTNMTVGNGTLTARHCKVGKLCTVKIGFRLGSTSAIGTIPTVTLPFTGSVAFGTYQVFGSILDAGAADFTAVAFLDTASISIFVLNSASTFLAPAVVNASTPMTWTTNDYFQFIFSYEVA